MASVKSLGLRELWIAVALGLGTLAVYGQVITHQFITFDDDLYIWNNPMVAAGLTFQGVTWAFTALDSGMWHPLTWLSHMTDSQLFGLKAGGHLFMNALIHVANTLLLFFFLRRVTGSQWRSAIVAALFALHPLHVESVAWASERKDTLSTFFGLLCLLAYASYVEKPSFRKYALVFVWLVLGLMAKPMLVTWPFVLLLLDYWPLRRVESKPGETFAQFAKKWWPFIREKLPLFVLIAGFVVVTYTTQAHEGAVADVTAAPLSWRLANSLASFAKYLLLFFWPQGLAIYYPAPDYTPAWQWVVGLVLLGIITVTALRSAKERKYLTTGWLWFLGTLVPVMGLVQVGSQSMADRYTYVPSIGLFIAIVFGIADLASRWRVGPVPIAIVSTAAILILATLSAIQLGRWQNSETLFTYVLSVTSDNRVAENNLGAFLGQQGRHADAVPHFAEALRIKPDYVDALENMGVALASQGKAAEAMAVYERALKIQPHSARFHVGIGQALANQGRNDEALRELREAVILAPDNFDTRMNLGELLTRQGNLSEANVQLTEALRLNPDSAEAHNDLGIVLMMSKQLEGGVAHFNTALRLKPDLAAAQDNLRRAQKEIEEKKK